MSKARGPKVVMVGGGSYNWCPGLLSDLMQTPEMESSEIVLLDPDLQAAREVAAAAKAIAAHFGKRFRILPTSSEATAFRHADFVIITISTGGLEAMAHDLKIPEKYGIFQTVGDTVGPGGWSRALRNVPVFVHLARQIEKYAPRAVVLNYTNPLAVLTGTISAVSDLRNVGLCHGVFSTYRLLEALLGVEESDLAVRFGGVNHFFWVLDFTVKGKPGYPALKRKLAGRSIDQTLRAGQTDEMGFHSHHLLLDELYRRTGYLTYAGDRHTCEFVPGYITPTRESLRPYRLVRTSIADRRRRRARARKYTLDLAAGKATPPARSRETAVDIMVAITTGKPFVDVVNVPNTGQIENLPLGVVVETLGLVDPLGFRPVTVGPLPAVLEAMVTPHCLVQEMTLQAALTGDRDLALEALSVDPICSHLSGAKIRKMGMELMEATRDWLGQFK